MLPFIRSDLSKFVAYTPHPGGTTGSPVSASDGQLVLDRLDSNENPYDLPAALKQKLAWVYQQEIAANRYPDGSHVALRQAIARYVIESGALSPDQVTLDHICLGNGSDELIRSLLIATCLRGEGSILVAQPTFSMYKILAQTLGIPVIEINRGARFEIDLAAAQVTMAVSHQPPIRVVFMVHPNSPTANPLTAAELDWLRGLPEQVLVVIDEAYFEFSQLTRVNELQQRPNWLILRTFSKAFRLAAHRVGYAIGHPQLVAALEKVRLPYNLPASTQATALLALTHRQELLAMVPSLLEERNRLIDSLATLPALRVHPSQANFIFVQLRLSEVAGNSAVSDALTQLFQTLKSQGTLVRQISGGLRITIGTAEENQRTLLRLQESLGNLLPTQ
jgi:histidinol-phosphate aminotransferase